MLWAGRCIVIWARADACKRRRTRDEGRKLRLRQLNANLTWHLWLGGEESAAPQIRQSRITPVVITDQINNPRSAGQCINSRPIRVHGNHLGFRRTRIENAPSFYGCAGGPFVDVFIECIDDVVRGAVACRAGHLQILDGPGLEAEPLRGHEISRIVIPGIAKEDPAIRVGVTAGKEHRRARAGSSLRGVKPLYSIVDWSRYRTWGHRQYVVECESIGGVILVILKNLVVGNGGLWEKPEVHPQPVSIHRYPVVFSEQITGGRAIDCAECRPYVHIVRITKPESQA